MLDLKKYFINPFDDKEISYNELISYSSRHLSRLVAGNAGAQFNQRITATTTALAGLDVKMQDNDVKLALRMARVQAKDTFRAVLPGNIAKVHAGVVAAFGEDSPVLTECFPQGRSVFGDCPDGQLDDKLGQLLACLTPLAAQVGQIHVDNVGGLLSTWIALAASVDTAEANKNFVENARRSAREVLQLELFKNLLTLALAFPNDMDKANMYCPQYLLEEPVSSLPPQAQFTLAESPAAGGVHLKFVADGATSFLLEHKGPADLVFAPIATVLEEGEFSDTGLAGGTHEYRVTPRNSRGAGPVSQTVSLVVAQAQAA
jgi:hypothetical protein